MIASLPTDPSPIRPAAFQFSPQRFFFFFLFFNDTNINKKRKTYEKLSNAWFPVAFKTLNIQQQMCSKCGKQ